MKTIEERAHTYLLNEHISPLNDILHQCDLKVEMQYHKDIEASYIQGAKEQRKIDIKKAIEWLDILLDGRPFLGNGWKDDLRKAMEE